MFSPQSASSEASGQSTTPSQRPLPWIHSPRKHWYWPSSHGSENNNKTKKGKIDGRLVQLVLN